MKIIEPGHIYDLQILDGDEQSVRLTFVNRETGMQHPGTQTQELLRVVIDILACLVDRTNHCDACLRWEGNDRIIKAMTEAQRQANLAILYHEQRALERKFEKGQLTPVNLPTGKDGHILVRTE